MIQIVTNTEDLQQYSAHTVFSFLRQPACPENLVKVGAYILGEYGHLIADNPGCSPIEQFNIIHIKSNFCSASTRALLLTTYIKWVNLFPEIKDILINVFERYRYVLDAELQQRASEYYILAKRQDNDQLLQIVCDEMPPFPERESALISSLDRKHGDVQDTRTWIIGGKEANRDRNLVRAKSLNKKVQGGILSNTSRMSTMSFNNANNNQLSSLIPHTNNNNNLEDNNNKQLSSVIPEKTTSGISLSTAPIYIIRNESIDKLFNELIYSYEGTLYDSDYLSISLKSEYHGQLGRLLIKFTNKMLSATLNSFSATIDVKNDENLNVTFPQMMANSVVVGGESVQQSVHVECKDLFDEAPTLRLSYVAGSHQTMALRFPILLNKFLEPVELV